MNRIFSSFLWRFLERCSNQVITCLVQIILARLLEPSAYGTVALVVVFTGIMGVFVNSGFGNALVQRKNADDLDFSSVFYFNMASSLVIYLMLYLSAPAIAEFYSRPELVPLVRVSGLSLLVAGVANIQGAYVARHMLFRKSFFVTLGGTACSAAVGIGMAYAGCGVWALVAQGLVSGAVGAALLWLTVGWRPRRMFSLQRLGGLFSYGWKLLVSALLDTGYGQLRALIIGRMYTVTDLAFYNRADVFPNIIVANVNASINSVLFPAMAAEQDDRARVRAMTRRAIKVSTYVMMPMMMGLAVCAEPFVRLVLTEKWLPCVPYLRIACFVYAFWPIHTANLNAISAMGRSDIFLKLEIVKKIVGLAAIGVSMWYGVFWMAMSGAVTSVLSQVINAYPNKRLLGYAYADQLRDMMPQILLSGAMGAAVYGVTFLGWTDVPTLSVQVVLGAVLYVAGSKAFRIDSFEYVWGLVKGLAKSRGAASPTV